MQTAKNIPPLKAFAIPIALKLFLNFFLDRLC